MLNGKNPDDNPGYDYYEERLIKDLEEKESREKYKKRMEYKYE